MDIHAMSVGHCLFVSKTFAATGSDIFVNANLPNQATPTLDQTIHAKDLQFGLEVSFVNTFGAIRQIFKFRYCKKKQPDFKQNSKKLIQMY